MSDFEPATLRQSLPMPSRPRPIVVVGAGSIVRDAHLPAYRKAGFPVAGIYDRDAARVLYCAEKNRVVAFTLIICRRRQRPT